jgi:hypothetical protein
MTGCVTAGATAAAVAAVARSMCQCTQRTTKHILHGAHLSTV